MILQITQFDISPGEEQRFEQAVLETHAVLASVEGFASMELRRGIEQDSRYALLVQWERAEDDVEGFRRSPQYERWREQLEPYQASEPTDQHFKLVARR